MDDDCPKCDVQSCNLTKCKTIIPDKNDYFPIIGSIGESEREKILNTIFPEEQYITVLNNITNDTFKYLDDNTNNKEWVSCGFEGEKDNDEKSMRSSQRTLKRTQAVKYSDNLCTLLSKYGKQELESTAYMLRVLTHSVIDIDIDFVMKKKEIKKQIEDAPYKLLEKQESYTPDELNIMVGHLTTEFDELNEKKTQINFGIYHGYEREINGIWENDKKYIFINGISRPDESFVGGSNNDNKGMLIMGLGPSGSGKSFMAEELITVLLKTIPGFQSFYFNIDGGKYRELSVVYQSVIEGIKQFSKKNQDIQDCINTTCKTDSTAGGSNGGNSLCITPNPKDYLSPANTKGIENLKDYINTTKIKEEVVDYLKLQKKDNKSDLQINLYVPDTLVSCGYTETMSRLGIGNCISRIKEYVEITNSKNNWISALIYQHKTEELCKKKYKCVGTESKGKERAKCESKPYSDKNWKRGYELGELFTMRKTYNNGDKPGLVIRIHNSGDKDRQSILESVKFNENHYKGFENTLLENFKNANFSTEDLNIKYGGGTRKRVRRKNVKGQKKTTRKKKCGRNAKRTRNTRKTKNAKKTRKTRKYRNKNYKNTY